MKDPRQLLNELRQRIGIAPSLPAREDWIARIDAIVQAFTTQLAGVDRLKQDVEDAEHARDAANLSRMRVQGQLNTLQKALAAATPEFPSDGDAQHSALRRIEHLVSHGGTDPEAAAAALEAEMEAPMPGQAVLEAVIAGTRRFNKAQLEFSLSEAIILTNWEITPLELQQKGEPWIAALILKNHGANAQDG